MAAFCPSLVLGWESLAPSHPDRSFSKKPLLIILQGKKKGSLVSDSPGVLALDSLSDSLARALSSTSSG